MPGNTVNKPFQVAVLDQEKIWIKPDGTKRFISNLTEEQTLFALDYSLANAKMLRERWSINKRQKYDDDERPRQWMLNRPVIRALIRRLIKLELAKTYFKLAVEKESDN